MFDLQANSAHFTLEIADFMGEIHVVGFEGEESLSQPFKFELELASEEPEIAFEQAINQPALLSLYGRDEPRTVHALIGVSDRAIRGIGSPPTTLPWCLGSGIWSIATTAGFFSI